MKKPGSYLPGFFNKYSDKGPTMSKHIREIQKRITDVLIEGREQPEDKEFETALIAEPEAAALSQIDGIISKFFQAHPQKVETQTKSKGTKHIVFKKIGAPHARYSTKLVITGTVQAEARVKKSKAENIYVMMFVYMPVDGRMVGVAQIHANGSESEISSRIINIVTKLKNDPKMVQHAKELDFYYDLITYRPPDKKFTDKIRDILKRQS
jgi:hypothetical protein